MAKRGRPLGSKNKKSSKKVEVEVVVPAKKRGRPVGSKNSKKEIEVGMPAKKRGRPVGSKNSKKSIEVEAPVKKRGRPAGKKSSKKSIARKKISKVGPEIVFKRTSKLTSKVVHLGDHVNKMCESVKEFGIVSPLIITPKGRVIVGNGRYQAAKNLGIKKLPCIVVSEKLANAIDLIETPVSTPEPVEQTTETTST